MQLSQFGEMITLYAKRHACRQAVVRQSAASFTLLELLVVLIIVGIMAALSITNYTKTSERAYDREAQSALSLIQSAERMRRLRSAAYYPPSGTEGDMGNINTNLKLNLAEQRWDYSIAGGTDTFTANATRSGRTWSINQVDSGASCSPPALCPPP